MEKNNLVNQYSPQSSSYLMYRQDSLGNLLETEICWFWFGKPEVRSKAAGPQAAVGVAGPQPASLSQGLD